MASLIAPLMPKNIVRNLRNSNKLFEVQNKSFPKSIFRIPLDLEKAI